MLFRREITALLAALPRDDTPEEHKIAFEAIREVKFAPMGYLEQLKRTQEEHTTAYDALREVKFVATVFVATVDAATGCSN